MKKILLIFLFLPAIAVAQEVTNINLKQLLSNDGLWVGPGEKVYALSDFGSNGITSTGMIWLKGLNFSTGTIELDLKGKDEDNNSYLGIAFHGIDTICYEAVYFRPFNFQQKDTLRKQHAVQYMSRPEHGWQRLRQEHPLVYEHAVIPAPGGDDWFHAKIVITDEWVTVYVNNSPHASLSIKKLSKRGDGKLGLWNSNLGKPGSFANLTIISGN